MMTSASSALANARAHAWASRLYSSDDLLPALSSATDAELQRALAQIGVLARTIPDFVRALMDRILPVYDAMIRSHPVCRDVLVAMLQLHEIENLKVAWRGIGRGIPADGWLSFWRPLGRFERLPRERCRSAVSLPDLSEKLRKTHFGAVVDSALRIHGSDPLAAEQLFSRFALGELLQAARRLPRREQAARRIVLARIRELDLEAVRRSVAILKRSPRAAVRSTVLLITEWSEAEQLRLTEWKPESGPIGSALPRSMRRFERSQTWDDLLGAMRRERTRLCIRALRGHPFRAAPAIAVVLLFEEQARAVTSLANWRAEPELREVLGRIVSTAVRS